MFMFLLHFNRNKCTPLKSLYLSRAVLRVNTQGGANNATLQTINLYLFFVVMNPCPCGFFGHTTKYCVSPARSPTSTAVTKLISPTSPKRSSTAPSTANSGKSKQTKRIACRVRQGFGRRFAYVSLFTREGVDKKFIQVGVGRLDNPKERAQQNRHEEQSEARKSSKNTV